MERAKSNKLFALAQNLIPGGVNSPVRACRSVGCDPLFIDHADGCMIYDADGNGYIDYIGSWGPLILGHRAPMVLRSISRALNRGISFGAPTELEIELAQLIIEAMPSIEMVRMVNSGTEATMSAIRLARAFTKREAIVKFDGCYHGHADSLLVEAGSGVATLAIPGSPGVPNAFVEKTISLPYNNIQAFQETMEKRGDEIACVIVEPVAGNMGLVPPAKGFLKTLREETTRHGAVLIFDEVMTGFRVSHGGAQALYDVRPDLTTLGKIIGGGMPVGAYGGRRDIMEHVAPLGPMYQAGTLSGNPVAMAAGIATLLELRKSGFYKNLDKKSDYLAKGFKKGIEQSGISATVNRVGSMIGMFFTNHPVTDFETAKTSDLKRFSAFYRGMLEKGIYLAPSQFEALFVSAAHQPEQLDTTIQAAAEVLQEIASQG
jgi:glutamate-1-semialdehyde 2,1-aminomutase